MTYAPAKFEVASSNGLVGRCIYKKIHYLTFDVWVTHNVAKYPLHLHNVTYVPAKFEFAMSNSLEGDALQENTLFDLLP